MRPCLLWRGSGEIIVFIRRTVTGETRCLVSSTERYMQRNLEYPLLLRPEDMSTVPNMTGPRGFLRATRIAAAPWNTRPKCRCSSWEITISPIRKRRKILFLKKDLTSSCRAYSRRRVERSEEHTSELQSQSNLVCR